MARMIPPTISPEVKSEAERRVFGWLGKMEWGNCIVLHSLGVTEHVNKIFGEIDFVIITDEGVLCVEVKGGVVERNNGKWKFINRYGKVTEKNEGPYMQAGGNEESLRKYLRRRIKDESDPICRCAYASCVMTPDCVISTDDVLEIISEITFDKRNTKEELIPFFKRCFKYWKSKTQELHGFQGGGLKNEDKERLVNILRGDFAFVPALSLDLQRTDEMLLALTDEQYIVMQGFNSKRMLIAGPAGTGKTLLAMDQCRKMHASGYSVLYLCFNRLISRHVRESFCIENIGIDVYTFHRFLMEKTKTSGSSGDDSYFKEELPELFLNEPDTYFPENERYDVIVIDEGQDLMNTSTVLCLDYIVKGGLGKGMWAVYYDKNQNIFGNNKELQEIYEQLEGYGAVSYELSINCRNTAQIARANWYSTNIKQASILKTEGEVVGWNKYKSKNEERKMLFKCLRRLLMEGISKSDIVILSPVRMDNERSCLYEMKIPSDIGQIRQEVSHDFRSDKFIKFYTVQSYKGLESRVIIYIDLDGFEDNNERLINYVAMSRARTLLEVFYDEHMEEARQRMMLQAVM